MKKLIVALSLVLICACAYADRVVIDRDGKGNDGIVSPNMQLPTGDDSAFGFLDLATSTQTFSPGAATRFDVSTIEIRKLYVYVYGGDLLVGHGNDLASGTLANGVLISSGTQGYIGGLVGTTTPPIWGLPTGVATITTKYSGWGNVQ